MPSNYAKYQKNLTPNLLKVIKKILEEPVKESGGTGICNQEIDWLMVDLYQEKYNVEYADITTSSARRYER